MSGITAGLSAHGRDASWAGTFECCGPCGRKRLIAADFSKKQVEKRQKDASAPMKCKQCVEQAAADERAQAAARQKERAATDAKSSDHPKAAGDAAAIDISDGSSGAQPPQLHKCATCERELASDAFNRTQLSKGAGKQRCRECVEKSEQTSAQASTERHDAAIEEARKALQQAEISGTAAQTLAASSRLAALEAQKVTGLKPVVLGKGGRGRGGGSWRGRSGRGGK